MIPAINLEKIQPFDVVLVHSQSTVGKLIQKATRFEYNHVGIVVEFNGVLFIAEAVQQGFKLTETLENFIKIARKKDKKLLFLRSKTNEPSKEKIGERLNELMNKKYEFINLLFFQLVKVTTGKWIGTKNINRVICSEAVAYCYQEYFADFYKVEPKEFYNSDKFNHLISIN